MGTAEHRRPAVITTLAILAILTIALGFRALLLPFTTVDVALYLLPWQRHADAVGSDYLRQAFTNYAPFYEHVLALLALFPGPPVLRVKLFSILFDGALALAVTLCCPRGSRLLAFAVVLVPTIAINSAMLGQSDAIYATAVMLSLAAALRDRPVLAMLAFSVAISIKLQAIFFLPVLALLALERRQPLWTFLLIPGVYGAFGLPMLLAGRPWQQVFLVYAQQSNTYNSLSLNAPNPWIFAKRLIDYQLGAVIGVPLAALIIGLTILLMWHRRLARTPQGLLLCAAILVLLGPFVAPKMHERYFYLVDPVLVGLAMRDRSYFKILALAEIGSLLAYVPFIAMVYGPDNWLFGTQGLLQRHFSFGYGVLAAVGALPMTAALALLVTKAMRHNERPA